MNIPANYVEQYRKRQITSIALAKILDVHPVTIRRALRHDPATTAKNKSALIAVREEFRRLNAHRPPKELTTLLHVSYSTAIRIRNKYGTSRTKQNNPL